MELFEIKKLNNSKYNYLIIANSYKNPFDNLVLLEKELKVQGKSKVLFDLFLINGQSSNRFVEAFFDGNNLVKDSFAIPKNIDEDVRELCSNYYIRNTDIIEKSILPNALKFLAMKGRV